MANARTKEANISSLIASTQLRMLRTGILIALDSVYPSNLDDVTLREVGDNRHGLLMIRRELHYLMEKQLVVIKTIPNTSVVATITARGRDFLNGDVAEVGIEPGSTFQYEGPANLR